ncbi:MAG: sigma-70 family RNA polymerase sigma factor [Rhodobacteraceae bacterium]|nr:sigma-70 family RNA polymerase sigma factor [Paracoccaceae bacterium]
MKATLAQVLAQVLAEDRGRILSALIARFRDFDLAEESLSEAAESALIHWRRSGLPENPRAWLMTVARRKALDRLRKSRRQAQGAQVLSLLADERAGTETPEIPDERLRLIFTCCHPALAPKSRVALTLRMLGGLTTTEIARAFLDSEMAMGQRLSRAKAKIAQAGIPFAVPGPGDWSARLESVLAVIYLIFNEGYAVTAGETPIRADLCAEAIFLGRMLDDLRPDEPETLGLLALMLITDARRAARVGPAGLVPLDQQDRRLWNRGQIADGESLIARALSLRAPGPFQIKAAIAALHTAEQIDRKQVFLLYDSLLRFEPTPVVRLNRAVALAETGEVEAALAAIETLHAELNAYQPFHAALADVRARAGQCHGAASAYARAIALAGSDAERDFLSGRRATLEARAEAEKKKAERCSAQVQQGGKDTGQSHVSHDLK